MNAPHRRNSARAVAVAAPLPSRPGWLALAAAGAAALAAAVASALLR